jgi:hypothetical protein
MLHQVESCCCNTCEAGYTYGRDHLRTNRLLLCARHVYPAIIPERSLQTCQQERIIRPRLTREARQLLRRIVHRREQSDPIILSQGSPVREGLQIDLGIHREGPHVNGRSHAHNLHRLGPEFRNVQRKAAVLHPVVQRAELNKS